MQSSSNVPNDVYELIDFGQGRKLESFGGVVVDRPCAVANGGAALPEAWESAELIYKNDDAKQGKWIAADSTTRYGVSLASVTSSWPVILPGLRLLAKPQITGQLGLFPEHWQQWPWLQQQLHRWDRLQTRRASTEHAPRALHLFAYTGASTLALARMRAEVTHVDAMRSAVEWARENSRASDMQAYPIRWIVDDARKYVEREQRRHKRYELILLDPPSYGHGADGRAWSIQRDLEPLLRSCASLVSEDGIGLVLTGHSPDLDLPGLRRALVDSKEGTQFPGWECKPVVLRDRSGRSLPCGYVARFLTESFSSAMGQQ